MQHSPAMDQRIRELAAKLEDLQPKITRCHVVVDETDRSKNKGTLFQVRVFTEKEIKIKETKPKSKKESATKASADRHDHEHKHEPKAETPKATKPKPKPSEQPKKQGGFFGNIGKFFRNKGGS